MQATSTITTPQGSWNTVSFYTEQTSHCINFLAIKKLQIMGCGLQWIAF